MLIISLVKPIVELLLRLDFVNFHHIILIVLLVVDAVHFDVQLVGLVELGVLEKQPLAVLLSQLVIDFLGLIVLPPGQAEWLICYSSDLALMTELGGGCLSGNVCLRGSIV